MHYYLIGFMGSGKTYWAKTLLKELGIASVDLDAVIVQQQAKTITEIFSNNGEGYFRDVEAATLRKLHFNQKTIISTGGGSPCYNNNMAWMNANGVTIWLNEATETIVERLQYAQEKRPLIVGKSKAELEQFVITKLTEREAFYNMAQHIILPSQMHIDTFKNIIYPHV